MANYLVEYKLNGNEKPYFIKDGGYFPFENRRFVGITYDEKECYLPESVTILTNQNIIDRIVAENIKNSITNEYMTNEEKTQLAISWLTEKGFIN